VGSQCDGRGTISVEFGQLSPLEGQARVPASLLKADQQEHEAVDRRSALNRERTESEDGGRRRLRHDRRLTSETC
jgi:hypothetical protein